MVFKHVAKASTLVLVVLVMALSSLICNVGQAFPQGRLIKKPSEALSGLAANLDSVRTVNDSPVAVDHDPIAEADTTKGAPVVADDPTVTIDAVKSAPIAADDPPTAAGAKKTAPAAVDTPTATASPTGLGGVFDITKYGATQNSKDNFAVSLVPNFNVKFFPFA